MGRGSQGLAPCGAVLARLGCVCTRTGTVQSLVAHQDLWLCSPKPSPHPPCPRSSAVDTLQVMLLRGGNEDVVQCVELEGGWESLKTSTGHEEGVARLAR